MPARRLRTLADLSRAWLTCPGLSWSERFAHYPRAVWAAGRGLVAEPRITYLGRPFVYDNPKTPLLLQSYPELVTRGLLANVRQPIETVLDVGANLGQLTVTLARLAPSVRTIDAFEANPTILSALQRNTAGLPGVRVFRLGVGPPGRRELFFTPTRSSVGSLIQANATHGRTATARAVTVELTDDVPAHTGRATYDLVKVDVEGAELEVVEALSGITARYLLLEVTGPAKQKPYRTSELYARVAEHFGSFEVLYQSASHGRSTVFDVLLELEPGR